MTDWYNLAWSDVVNLMQSNANMGLIDEEVKLNREKYGANKIIDIQKKKLMKSMLKQVVQPWTAALLICSVAYSILHVYFAMVVLLVLLLISAGMLFMEKHKDKKDLKALLKFNAGECTVVRNGILTTINNEDVVVGDIVVYNKGSVIPADIRIMDCRNLSVIEAAVTKDNHVIDKYSPRLLEYDLSLSEMRNILFKSSVVHNGEGEGIVVAVGMNTEIGKLMETFLEIEQQENVFYKGISSIVNITALIGILGSLAVALSGIVSRVTISYVYASTATLLATSVPFGISIIIYIIGFIIKFNLNRQGIFIKGISKIQTASSMDVLISEKEGIFTRGIVNVIAIYDNDTIQHVNYEFVKNDNINRIMETIILCNDSKSGFGSNNLIESALLNFGKISGINKIELEERQKRILKMPYDKEKRIKTTVNKVDKNYRAYVKGAVDVLIEECTHIMKNGIEKELTEDDIGEIKSADIGMSNESLYVIGLAYRNFKYKPSVNENIESNLIFVGLVGLENPIKDDIDIYIKKARLMGLKPVLYTEDSKLTSIAVGKEINILNVGETVISGIEMDYMEEGELERNIQKISIFSRILLAHKMKIVKAYKDIDYKVALTGNKLMDLSPLKIADLSISFGKNCSNIVKKLSDIYVKNIDFKLIIDLVFESKSIINSLRYIIEILCISSLSQFSFCLISILFYNKIPFSFNEILWFNMFNAFIISLLIFVSREKITNNTNVKKFIDKSIWSEDGKSIILDSLILALICIVVFEFPISSSSSGNITETFAFFSAGQIILMIKVRFMKNWIFDLLLALYIASNIAIIITKLGGMIIGLKVMDLSSVVIVLAMIVVYIVILSLKGILTKQVHIMEE